ncbi:MAG TPA: ornithine cyclodeaminase family protein [Candidatus Bathyarchaeia archaeon]|nr:ornithine cyclodeaminase family protein [Candidatus Bathyarchaeia archaeon]
MKRLRTITESQVQHSLTAEKAIDLAKEAYFRLARGEALNPERTVLTVPTGLSVYCMPGYVSGRATVTVKVARANPSNPTISLPTVTARLHVYDSNTGEELAQIEAETFTALRTAASSAIATDLLAPKDADSLGIFGTGRQATAHVDSIMKVRSIEKVLVYSRSKDRRTLFAKQVEEETGIPTVAADSQRGVVDNSRILVLATNSVTPLFKGEWVKPGTHVNAIGVSTPDAREMDTDLIRRSLLVVDSEAQAVSTYGDVVIPLREGAIDESQIIELGSLLIEPGIVKRQKDQITVFKSGGLAVLDAIMADYLVTTGKR